MIRLMMIRTAQVWLRLQISNCRSQFQSNSLGSTYRHNNAQGGGAHTALSMQNCVKFERWPDSYQLSIHVGVGNFRWRMCVNSVKQEWSLWSKTMVSKFPRMGLKDKQYSWLVLLCWMGFDSSTHSRKSPMVLCFQLVQFVILLQVLHKIMYNIGDSVEKICRAQGK